MLSELIVPMNAVPRIHFGQWVDTAVTWLTEHWSSLFNGIAHGLNTVVGWLQDGLLSLPIFLVVAVLAVIALLARGWLAGIGSAIGVLLIDAFDQWANAMDTLAIVVVASVIAIVLAIPLGIIAARLRSVSLVTKPVMDFMQTLPSFVYLLPALFLLGLGAAPAILATIVFAMPPGVRLTELGIRQVDQEMVEAGQAFGATPREVLRGIQIPLAMPTVMAGVNQVIMLALSMTVIAGLVGAGGLGGAVVQALQTLDVSLGAESGVAVVILAIYLDRVTAAVGQRGGQGGGLRRAAAVLRGPFGRRTAESSAAGQSGEPPAGARAA